MAKYELRVRAERMAETRQRIIEATAKLHQTIGPAATSISAIADAAGVQRHTVYSHFPEEKALFAACGGLFYQRHPPPGTEPWRDLAPEERVRRALTEMYAYFRSTERQLWPVVRDAPVMRGLVGGRIVTDRESMVSVVTAGWGIRGGRAVKVRALLTLALRFETWRALTHDRELDDAAAASVMADAVLCAAGMA